MCVLLEGRWSEIARCFVSVIKGVCHPRVAGSTCANSETSNSNRYISVDWYTSWSQLLLASSRCRTLVMSRGPINLRVSNVAAHLSIRTISLYVCMFLWLSVPCFAVVALLVYPIGTSTNSLMLFASLISWISCCFKCHVKDFKKQKTNYNNKYVFVITT